MPLDLPILFRDVFHPIAGEKIAFLIDLPTDRSPENPEWVDRRKMAVEWLSAFRAMGHPTFDLLTYPATGANGADLPSSFTGPSGEVLAEDVFSSANIIVAMTEFSATGPLMRATQRHKNLRVASMPGVTRAMEATALTVDHARLRLRVKQLAELLNEATAAEVLFSTGHRVTFDLRHRSNAMKDAGECFPDSQDRLINLPTGEAFTVPYEGEIPGDPSQTNGEIPVCSSNGEAALTGSEVVFEIREGQIVNVTGDPTEAAIWNAFFEADPARRHVAELGLGCNDRAVVSGSVLEDEKAGMHWAYGRNEYFDDGHNAVANFRSPETVVHIDIVYAPASPIQVRSLRLIRDNQQPLEIIRDSQYTL